MNKLTKVGCSALCGSLAAIASANAGTLSVTGGADMTWISNGTAVTGNPLGIGSNYTLNGAGELDNGWAFSLAIANTNLNAYSATVINLDMGGLGSLNFNSGNSGNGISAVDDKMPTAWEEAWGAGVSTGVRLPLGSGASQNIQYKTPSFGENGSYISLTHAYDYGSADTNDKATAATEDQAGSSTDAVININPSLGTEILSGLNIFAGASQIKANKVDASRDDAYEGVAGITYDIGPLSLGAQWSGDYTGVDAEHKGHDQNVYNFYKAVAYGVAFNVNDDLSVSYGRWTHRKAGTSSADTATTNAEIDVTSAQIAYTMGGASIRIADTDAEDVSWSDGNNQSATTISLGLAF
jgi:hypothetical protein